MTATAEMEVVDLEVVDSETVDLDVVDSDVVDLVVVDLEVAVTEVALDLLFLCPNLPDLSLCLPPAVLAISTKRCGH